MGIDISKVIGKVQEYIDKINQVIPHHWKGNIEPQTHHFDPASITPSVDLDIPGLKASLAFDFTDNGVAHRIEADLPLNDHTLQDFASKIVLDGVEQPNGSVEFGTREGLEGFNLYLRAIVRFRFTGPDGQRISYRFDGDLA